MPLKNSLQTKAMGGLSSCAACASAENTSSYSDIDTDKPKDHSESTSESECESDVSSSPTPREYSSSSSHRKRRKRKRRKRRKSRTKSSKSRRRKASRRRDKKKHTRHRRYQHEVADYSSDSSSSYSSQSSLMPENDSDEELNDPNRPYYQQIYSAKSRRQKARGRKIRNFSMIQTTESKYKPRRQNKPIQSASFKMNANPRPVQFKQRAHSRPNGKHPRIESSIIDPAIIPLIPDLLTTPIQVLFV